MLKNYARKIWLPVKNGLAKIWRGICRLAHSWPKLFAGGVLLLVFLYYPLGGWLSEKIDRTEDYELAPEAAGTSPTLEMMAFLVDREVNEHIWIANLPLFFPSYFLDNMPNFQTGIIEALANAGRLLAPQMQCEAGTKEQNYMADAAKLLSYPGNVWLFAPDNKLKTAPSSSNQYRKGRKLLRELNGAFAGEKCFWYKTPQNLTAVVEGIAKDLAKTSEKLEQQINEGNAEWIDYRADDAFYNAEGRAYAYFQLLKSLGKDYKQVLVGEKVYADWTKAINALQNAVAIRPSVVRNSSLNAVWNANHLASLAYYLQKAENVLLKINIALEGAK